MTAPSLRERLEAMREWLRTDFQQDEDTEADIATLTEALAALAEREKDAERLDWLSKQQCGIDHTGYGEYRYYSGGSFKPIREVIDAAIKENK